MTEIPVTVTMEAATEKDAGLIERARNLSHTDKIWCDEYEKMISGMLYNPQSSDLAAGRHQLRKLIKVYNDYLPADSTSETLASDREVLLQSILGHVGKFAHVEPPFRLDYGCNISIGHWFYANYNVTILDGGLVTIGDRVWIGTNCIISATTHGTLASQRRKHVGGTWGKSITIGNDVWIGGNSVVMPGVTIGSGAVIGCNSVVRNDIPGSCIAVGSPAKVIKHLEHTPEIPEAILQAILNPTLAKL